MIWPAEEFIDYLVGQAATATEPQSDRRYLPWLLTEHFGLTSAEASAAGKLSGPFHAAWTADSRIVFLLHEIGFTTGATTSVGSLPARSGKDLREALYSLRKTPSTDMGRLYAEATARKSGIELKLVVLGNASPALLREIERLNEEFRSKPSEFSGHHATIIQLRDLNAKFCESLQGKQVDWIDITPVIT